MMRREKTFSYPVSIFVAGDSESAKRICRTYCDKEGLCVTVTPTTYVYTGGEEAGVIVGLINYARFPAEPWSIERTAIMLAVELMHKLEQESVSVQTPEKTHWFSIREVDLALAAGSRRAKTPKAVECEASQSGGAKHRNAQTPPQSGSLE